MTTNLKRKLWEMVIIASVTLGVDSQIGLGMTLAWLFFDPIIKYKIREAMDFISPEINPEYGPPEHDGPWAVGWETRCDRGYLEEAHRKSKSMVKILRDELS